YGLRHRGEHVMADHLRQVAADNPNIQLNICYSDPRPGDDKQGHDYQHGERVSIDLFKRGLPSNQAHYYLCGPPPMMESLVKGLEGWGVPEDHIHFEAFGPASVKKAAPVAAGEAGKYAVAFSRSDKKVMWDGKMTLLEVAEA